MLARVRCKPCITRLEMISVKFLLLLSACCIISCKASSFVIHYDNVRLQDFNPALVTIHHFSFTKYNDTSIKFSTEVTPRMDFGNDVMVSFRMFKKENDQYEEFPLAFTSPACDIWESLYNIKDMENYGNLTACNVEKNKMMYIKDYVPSLTLPANIIGGTYKAISKYTFKDSVLCTAEAEVTIDSPLDQEVE